ncbi:MAG: hypothetical protein Q4B85_10080 [Lachnospiraceae bacterium]|nr:hypothetical protein [Lachnospiraceae bacterium]
MTIVPKALAEDRIAADLLREDKRICTRYEEFGLGKEALFTEFFGFSCMGYIPLSSITRVYKRLAVTKGFFQEGKIYGTLCYLVVCYDQKEKAFRFKHEETLNALIDAIRKKTEIPVGKI